MTWDQATWYVSGVLVLKREGWARPILTRARDLALPRVFIHCPPWLGRVEVWGAGGRVGRAADACYLRRHAVYIYIRSRTDKAHWRSSKSIPAENASIRASIDANQRRSAAVRQQYCSTSAYECKAYSCCTYHEVSTSPAYVKYRRRVSALSSVFGKYVKSNVKQGKTCAVNGRRADFSTLKPTMLVSIKACLSR